jgi:hypothetical protein
MKSFLATLLLFCSLAQAHASEPYVFQITTPSRQAKTQFTAAMLNFYAYNYTEAERLFRLASLADPQCAMCLWGEVLAQKKQALELSLPYLNQGSAAELKAAQRLTKTDLERDVIAATAVGFEGDGDAYHLHKQSVQAFATLRERYPNDANVLALSIDAMVDVPQALGVAQHCAVDYNPEALSLIEQGLKRFPKHPALLHYHLHTRERTSDMTNTQMSAETLAQFDIGHFQHMPCHYYYRIGAYQQCVQANQAAIAADHRYFQKSGVGAQSYYYEYHYLHYYHFLWWLGAMLGDAKMAVDNANFVVEHLRPTQLRSLPEFVDVLYSTKILAHARFGQWHEVLAVSKRADSTPFGEVNDHFARSLAYLHLQQQVEYGKESEALKAVLQKPVSSSTNQWAELANAYLQGVKAKLSGDHKTSITAFEKAAVLENALPRSNPPTWIFPARLALAEVLEKHGEIAYAKKIIEDLLKQWPKHPEGERLKHRLNLETR